MAKRISHDYLFKLIMRSALSRYGVNVETELEVGVPPLKIDALAVCTSDMLSELRLRTPFPFLTEQSILEFKSATYPLTERELARIMCRALLFFSEQQVVHHRQLSVHIVCERYPR
ncbi:MAG TPA: hypothetical protein EYP10_02820, partial [Armatimonadetes bacterium]|nr:hypothetical protein [Armatimonadota bacterium]